MATLTSPQPEIQGNPVADLQNYYQQATSQNSGQGSPFTLNPFSGQAVSNPNFLNPLQAQQLRQAQFEYDLQTNPTLAAIYQNMQKLESIVPTAELTTYRDQNGNVPRPGTTYADLEAGGYQAVSPDQALQAQQLESVLSQLQQAAPLAQHLSSSGGTLGAGLQGILGHLGLGSFTPAYTQYQNIVNAIPAQYRGALPTPGAPLGPAYQTAVSNLQSQARQLNPSPVAPLSQPVTDPYGATTPAMLNPAQLGANARRATLADPHGIFS